MYHPLNACKYFFPDGQDPEGPYKGFYQPEMVPPTRESNALVGSLLEVDQNRADIYAKPALQLTPEEEELLELEGIGIFGDDFSKKIEEEITEEPYMAVVTDAEPNRRTKPQISRGPAEEVSILDFISR